MSCRSVYSAVQRVTIGSSLAYVIQGSTQITAVDQLGRNYVATVEAGDLWYFPPGIPHSLQATNDSAAGSEFLLVCPSSALDSLSVIDDHPRCSPAVLLAMMTHSW